MWINSHHQLISCESVTVGSHTTADLRLCMINRYPSGMWNWLRRTDDVEMITVPLADWLTLNDSVKAERASRVLGNQPVLPAAQQAVQPFTQAQIEMLLTEHYKQMLVNPAARKVVRKMLSDAAAVERMAKVGR